MVDLQRNIDGLIKSFAEHTSNLTLFLSVQPELEKKLKIFLKQTYDITKRLENTSKNNSTALPKLIIKNFDVEQIWHQLELQNQAVYDDLSQKIRSYGSTSNQSFEESQESENQKKKVRFLLDDLNSEEEEEENEADSAIEEDISDANLTDLEESLSSSENEDKFSERNVQKQSNNSTDIDKEDTSKSSFEERQKRLQKRVEKLEEEALTEKPWQLKGEITAKKRPHNSLLEEILEFDLSVRPAPIVTEEAALKLEDIIIKRIQNKAWDDVERKTKPVNKPLEFKKELVLDQQKSKLSLAQVYEQQYLNQKKAANPETESKEEEPKEHKQLKLLLDSLFLKLDVLTNFHFTPVPPTPELNIITNLPAVQLEDAIPSSVSQASLLAPEEIQSKRKGDLMGNEERTATDRKRERRKKKLRQKRKQKKRSEREKILKTSKSGTHNNFSKEKAIKQLDKSVLQFQENADNTKVSRSSKQFFERLQDTVDSKTNFKRKNKNVAIDAKRIKL